MLNQNVVTSLESFLKKINSEVSKNEIRISKNEERGKSVNGYASILQPYSIYIGNVIVADVYDLSFLQNNEKKEIIHKAGHNAICDDVCPVYVFFYDKGNWRALHVQTINYSKDDAFVSLMSDYSEEYENNIWSLSFEDVVERIKKYSKEQIIEFFVDSFIKILKNIISEYEETDWGKRVTTIINSLDNNSFCFERTRFCLNPLKEVGLFKALLGNCPQRELYKYTSGSTLLYIFKDMTLSMSSLACMNDNTECFYANDYIVNGEEKRHGQIDHTFDYLFGYNNFITSLSTISPNELLMWRLYGENTKGIAIEFINDTEDLGDEFFIAPVSYAQKDGKHIELDFIKKMLSLRVEGQQMVLRHWFAWQYFFKKYDYKIEKEIRILYIPISPNDNEWTWINANGIISPIVKFKLKREQKDSYPLKVTKIYLGPNYVEAEINKQLIQEGLRKVGLKITVEKSNIKHYRNN